MSCSNNCFSGGVVYTQFHRTLLLPGSFWEKSSPRDWKLLVSFWLLLPVTTFPWWVIFLEATVTNDHKLAGIKEEKFIPFSSVNRSWRLRSQEGCTAKALVVSQSLSPPGFMDPGDVLLLLSSPSSPPLLSLPASPSSTEPHVFQASLMRSRLSSCISG